MSALVMEVRRFESAGLIHRRLRGCFHSALIRDGICYGALLFAVGECASMYHGANRLGGNSLLAAVYSGHVAADEIAGRNAGSSRPDFERELKEARGQLEKRQETDSQFPVMYIRDMLAETMQKQLGIVRTEEKLTEGLKDVEYYLSVAERINYDSSVMPYFNYSLTGILTLAKATLKCALARKESRGAHYRSDYPDSDDSFRYATLVSCCDGRYLVDLDKEHVYES